MNVNVPNTSPNYFMFGVVIVLLSIVLSTYFTVVYLWWKNSRRSKVVEWKKPSIIQTQFIPESATIAPLQLNLPQLPEPAYTRPTH